MSAEERPRLGEREIRWLEGLHLRMSDRMLRIAARTLPALDRASAEDVVQTVFAEALASMLLRPQIQIGEGWLMERLRSRIIDYHRRRRQQQRLLAAVAATWQEPCAEDLVIVRAGVEELLATITDPIDRRTLDLKRQGYREAEIAGLLSLSYEGRQVRDRLRRMRRQVSTRRDGAAGRPPTRPTSSRLRTRRSSDDSHQRDRREPAA